MKLVTAHISNDFFVKYQIKFTIIKQKLIDQRSGAFKQGEYTDTVLQKKKKRHPFLSELFKLLCPRGFDLKRKSLNF